MRISVDEVIAFVIPLAMLVQFKIVGTLLGTDILSFCLLFFYLLNKSRLKILFGVPTVLLLTFGLWLLGAILTDIFRDSLFENFVRGWSKIVFFGICFSALWMLSLGRLSVLLAYLLGICAAWILKSALLPDGYIVENPWKFGYSQAITSLVAMLVSVPFMKRHFGLLGEVVPLLTIAAVNLMLNFRSMFGIVAAAGLFCVLKYVMDLQPTLRRRLSPVSFAAIFVLGLGVAQGLISFYGVVAAEGVLGTEAKEKYEAQSTGDLGILLSGRGEIFASIQAIADSPILGHGSWAQDFTYIALLFDKLEEHGIVIQGDPFASGLIPGHSHLFGSWIQAGIGGGLFWVAVLGLCVVALYRTLKLDNVPTPLLAFVLLLMLWDILFSPFGQEQRFLMASKVAIALWVLRQPVRLSLSTGSQS